MPGAAHRDARGAEPERAAERVGDDHGHLRRSRRSASRSRARRGVGVEREEDGDVSAAGVRAVDAGRGADEAVPRLADRGTTRGGARCARSRRGSARSCAGRPRPPRSRARAARARRRRARRCGPRPSRPPSVRRRRRRRRAGRRRSARSRREEPAEIVARRELGQARAGPMTATSLTARARRARARRRSRRRASASARRPRAGRAPGCRRTRLVGAVEHERRRRAARARPATPTAETSCPSVSSIPASGPLTALGPIIGVIATTSSRRASTAARTPSTARIGSSDTNGLDGASTMRSALVDRLEHARAPDGRPGRPRSAPRSRGRLRAGRRATPGTPARRPGVTMRVRRRSSLAGSRLAPSP